MMRSSSFCGEGGLEAIEESLGAEAKQWGKKREKATKRGGCSGRDIFRTVGLSAEPTWLHLQLDWDK